MSEHPQLWAIWINYSTSPPLLQYQSQVHIEAPLIPCAADGVCPKHPSSFRGEKPFNSLPPLALLPGPCPSRRLDASGSLWKEQVKYQVLPNHPRVFSEASSPLPPKIVAFGFFFPPLILLVSIDCKFKVSLCREGSYIYKRTGVFVMKSGCDRK